MTDSWVFTQTVIYDFHLNRRLGEAISWIVFKTWIL